MLTGKQRKFLKGLAHDLDPLVLIGKQGATDNVYDEVDRALRTRELVKIKLQEGCDLDPKALANEMAERLAADFVQAIGRKFVLYRETDDEKRQDKKIVLPK